MQTRLIFLITLLLIATRAALAGPQPNNVTIQLRWQHQFQFAGYYAALHKGFYKDAGLQVTLKEGGPNISAIEEVIQGRADFGVSTSGLVKSYLEGKPVLMLAPILQHSPQVLLTLDPMIKTPADVAKAGMIGLQPGDESLDLKAMFVNEGILLDKLNINTDGLGLRDLLSGKIVAMNAYLSNEPFFLQKRGTAYSVVDARQYGMDFYSDVLFTSRIVGKDRPDVVASFRAATLKGWEYALAHQDEIIGLILSQYNTQAKSREYLIFEAKTLANLIGSDVIQLGHSNPGRWRHIVETYAKFGVIKFNYSLDGFFYDPHPPPPDMTWLFRLLATVLLAMGAIAGIAFYIHRLNQKLHIAHTVIETRLHEQHQFIDMLTHELKTPISVVTLTLDQVAVENTQRSAKDLAERALEDMNKIVENCQQLDQLDHQKLTPQLQQCQISEILSRLKINSPTPEQIAITVASVSSINSDPQLLEIVFGNLFDNALRYSPAGSVVNVNVMDATNAGAAGTEIRIQNMPGAAGTPDPEKIFKKYYRSSGAQTQVGSGLGLYLVQGFTELLGGNVRYAVEDSHIRMTVWLPC